MTMKLDLNKLPELISEKDAARLDKSFESVERGSETDDSLTNAVLSSVMRKAGFEMKPVITNNRKTNKAKTNDEAAKIAEVSRFGKGGVAAACIAFALVGTIGAAMLFGNKVSIDKPMTQPEESQTSAEQPSELVSAAKTAEEEQPPELVYEAEIPDVAGMSEKDAFEAIENAGLIPIKRETYDDKTESGKVVRTEPDSSSGKRFRKNSEVTVFISKGNINVMPDTAVLVPDLTDLTLKEAAAVLDGKGIIYSVENIDNPEKKNVVLGQSIAPGEYIDKEATLFIYMSVVDTETGAEVPNVVGLTCPEAIDRIKKSDLDYKIEEIEAAVKKGLVCEQSIAPETPVAKGSAVTIFVSTGEWRIRAEDVIRLSNKGTNLKVSDFERYKGEDVGSGLYIMRYEIADRNGYAVLVGSDGTSDTPLYVTLVNSDTGEETDLLTEKISADFVENDDMVYTTVTMVIPPAAETVTE